MSCVWAGVTAGSDFFFDGETALLEEIQKGLGLFFRGTGALAGEADGLGAFAIAGGGGNELGELEGDFVAVFAGRGGSGRCVDFHRLIIDDSGRRANGGAAG